MEGAEIIEEAVGVVPLDRGDAFFSIANHPMRIVDRHLIYAIAEASCAGEEPMETVAAA